MRSFLHIALLLAAPLFCFCSTVKYLPEGTQRLTRNKVEVVNDKHFNSSEISPYIKQAAKGWSPSLCIYNWQNGKGKGWDRFVIKLGKPPVVFDSTLVSGSIDNIGKHLDYLGYYCSSVDTDIIHKGSKKVQVKYSVRLGHRYPISSISYSVPSAHEDFTTDFYADTSNCSIRKGDYLSEKMLEGESARGAASLRNKGYYDFSKNHYFFEADTTTDPSGARLRIIIKEHTRNETDEVYHDFSKYEFGKVSLELPCSLKFRTKVLADLNRIHTGEPYSEKAVKDNYTRLSTISLFNSVNMELTPVQGHKVDCDINLSKTRTQGFKIGLEASINSTGLFGISPEISYFHRNIFHGGEILNISVSTNHQFKFDGSNARCNEVSTSASLIFPRFLPFSTKKFKGIYLPRTEVKLSYNYQNRPEYIRNMFSANFGYLGKFSKDWYYQFNPISLKFVQIPYMSEEFKKSIAHDVYLSDAYSDHLDLGINGMLYYTTDNSTNPHNTYWYTKLQVDLSGNFLAMFYSVMPKNEQKQGVIFNIPYSQYVRAEWNIGKTWFWGKKLGQSFATRFIIGAGYAYGNSTALPYEKQFYSGGANSLRGWIARTVGPGTAPIDSYWTVPNQTGDFKMELNAEYRFRMVWKFYGALFAETGNIWNLSPDAKEETRFSFKTLGESLAADWGLGLRLDLNFLLIRVDWGMRIHDPARTGSKWCGPNEWFNQSACAVHFGVGYPF